MGFATGVVKYLVFLANLVFALAGLALIVIGVIYKININEATRVLPADFGIAPTLSIIVGSIVFITAFLGCCGAVRESTCMLTTYAIILLTIFIIQIAIGVYAFLQIKDSDEFQRTIQSTMEKTFNQYRTNEEARESTDVTQRYLHCCGVRSYYEWGASIPASCCRGNEYQCSPASPTLYQTGCARAMNDFLQRSIQIIGAVAIGIAATEIIGAVFALCLASSIRNSYRRGVYA